MNFSCPKCLTNLNQSQNTLQCENGHSYDIAKSGYVNLLMAQKRSSHTFGDDKAMVEARKAFLDGGHYEPLKNMLCEIIKNYFPLQKKAVILDCGCGEGYYTQGLLDTKRALTIFGIDISKNAVIHAVKRCRDESALFAVANAFKVPLADGSCDGIVSIFAPYSIDEVKRLMSPCGFFIEVSPTEDHLIGLKAAVYDETYLNTPPIHPEGMTLIERKSICYTLKLHNNSEIQNLFTMTPYTRKTSQHDKAKLDKLNELSTLVGFYISVYRL